jgi:hypothetical protein
MTSMTSLKRKQEEISPHCWRAVPFPGCAMPFEGNGLDLVIITTSPVFPFC